MKKTEEDQKLLTISFRGATAAFLTSAIKASGESRPDFMRNAVVKAAEKALDKKAPEVAPFIKGRTSEITVAARGAGLTTTQFMRKLACEKLGIPFALKGKKAGTKRAKKA